MSWEGIQESAKNLLSPSTQSSCQTESSIATIHMVYSVSEKSLLKRVCNDLFFFLMVSSGSGDSGVDLGMENKLSKK